MHDQSSVVFCSGVILLSYTFKLCFMSVVYNVTQVINIFHSYFDGQSEINVNMLVFSATAYNNDMARRISTKTCGHFARAHRIPQSDLITSPIRYINRPTPHMYM